MTRSLWAGERRANSVVFSAASARSASDMVSTSAKPPEACDGKCVKAPSYGSVCKLGAQVFINKQSTDNCFCVHALAVLRFVLPRLAYVCGDRTPRLRIRSSRRRCGRACRMV